MISKEVSVINRIFERDIDLSIFEPYKVDCAKCCGLCCVALYFTKSDGFPKDKEAGTACPNLRGDYMCKIHSALSDKGLKGCLAYDCFGAGQYVTQQLDIAPDWSTISSREAEEIFNSYLVVLRVHQTLWYLSQCLILHLSQPEKEKAKTLINDGRELLEKSIEIIATSDPQFFYEKSNEYLKHICTVYTLSKGKNMSSKNYMGKNMKRKNLAGNDFSMSLLIAANLEQAELSGANFLGADMRDTNIYNTDLSKCLFLTQIQVNTARGNKNTIIPPYLHKPEGWNYNN